MSGAVLSLRDFRVSFKTPNGVVQAVRGVDLDVNAGEMVGVVGESGSGKSVTFLGMLGLLPSNAKVEGSATVNGVEMVHASHRTMRSVRGKQIAGFLGGKYMVGMDHLRHADHVQIGRAHV